MFLCWLGFHSWSIKQWFYAWHNGAFRFSSAWFIEKECTRCHKYIPPECANKDFRERNEMLDPYDRDLVLNFSSSEMNALRKTARRIRRGFRRSNTASKRPGKAPGA